MREVNIIRMALDWQRWDTAKNPYRDLPEKFLLYDVNLKLFAGALRYEQIVLYSFKASLSSYMADEWVKVINIKYKKHDEEYIKKNKLNQWQLYTDELTDETKYFLSEFKYFAPIPESPDKFIIPAQRKRLPEEVAYRTTLFTDEDL